MALNVADLEVAIGTGDDSTVTAVPVPSGYFTDTCGTGSGAARNMAKLWSAIARDMAEGTSDVPDFQDATLLLEMVEAVEQSARAILPVVTG
jgi:hypothetical protein